MSTERIVIASDKKFKIMKKRCSFGTRLNTQKYEQKVKLNRIK